jgi:PTH1 family peptidyl-tRNA hydrolase
LDDTIRCLGTDEVARLRVGIGPVPEGRDAADFVLGRFTADEKATMTEVVARSADAVISWGTAGVATAMNKYN